MSRGVLLKLSGRLGRILGRLEGVFELSGRLLGRLAHDSSRPGQGFANKNGPMMAQKSYQQ